MKRASIYRYPGVQPFRPDQKSLFFGRKSDIDALFELIFTEKVTVLYGKSGYGKSSLLNAGILPRLTNDRNSRKYRFVPVTVRFFTWSGNQDDTPVKKFIARLAETLPYNKEAAFLDRPALTHNLWWECVRRISGDDTPRLVFIFDQFEEFFTYPEEAREAFKTQFAEVLFGGFSNDAGRIWTDEEESFLDGRLEAKALFSIRADRLSLLDQMTDRIPGILRKLYELKGLTRDQAMDAVIQPALLESDNEQSFLSPCFEYTGNAIQQILEGLGGKLLLSGRGVEAFQLQILCQYIEGEVIKGNIPDRDSNGLPDVDVSDLPDLANIYEAYYRRQIQQMPDEDQFAARIVVEDGLLFVNEQSGEARRLSMDADALVQGYKKYGVSTGTLQRLEDAFLLRREANTLGGYNYEISHDTLIAPMLKARAERLAELEQDQLRKEAEEATRKQREAERKRRVALLFAILGTVLTIVASIAMVIAIRAGNEARDAEQRAETARRETQLALDQVLQKEREKNMLQARDKLKSAEKNIQAGFFDAAREDLGMALKMDTSTVIRQEVLKLQKQIK